MKQFSEMIVKFVLKVFAFVRCRNAPLAFALAAVLGFWVAIGISTSEAGTSLDPSARLPEGKKAWEYWDIVAEAESGHRVYVRFMITNVGPGSGTAVVVGHVVFPDGNVYAWDDGEISGDWTLADDRRRMDIGSSHLDLRDPNYRIEIDKEDLVIDLSFAPYAGVKLTGDDSTLDLHTETLALSAPIEGRIGAPDDPNGGDVITGLATFTHSWGSEPEPDSLLRRIELISMKNGLGLQVVDLTSSKLDRTRWLLVSRGDEIIHVTSNFELSISDIAPDHDQKKYWVPGKLDLNGSSVVGTATSLPVQVVLNPLGIIPQPLRFFVALSMKPHRVWAQADIDLTIDVGEEAPLHIVSSGTLITTYLNHFPRPKD